MSSTDTITINRILNTVAERQATDVHFVVGNYPFIRVKGKLVPLDQEELITPETMESIISFFVPEEKKEEFETKKDLKYIYDWLSKARFRVHAFQQKGYFSISLKLVPSKIHNLADLGLPKIINDFLKVSSGLVFITGPFNSGRSTTLASMIQTINQTQSKHILYLEEPIEHLFVNDKSVIEQREVGQDVDSFAEGLRSAKDEDVDIVAVSKVEGPEVIELLLELAESGRLVIALMDNYSAITALEEIVSEFTDAKVDWSKNILSELLVGVIDQRLIPTIDGDMVLAVGILTLSPSSKALIKEGRFSNLESIIQTSKAEGMISLQRAIYELAQKGKISAEAAVSHASDATDMKKMLKK